MNLQKRYSETKRSTGNMPGLVIAAIGFQLLLCSAAHACSGTIDRLPGSVVHALREMVERQAAHEIQIQVFEPGYRLVDSPLVLASTAEIESRGVFDSVSGLWLLNLPPPLA